MILLDRRQECLIRKYERGNCGNKRPWPEAFFPISLIVTGRKYVYWNNRFLMFSEGFAHRNTQTLNVPMTNCLFLTPPTPLVSGHIITSQGKNKVKPYRMPSRSILEAFFSAPTGHCVINPDVLHTFSDTGYAAGHSNWRSHQDVKSR